MSESFIGGSYEKINITYRINPDFLICLGCAQKKLTNEKAKSVIIEHFKYPQPVYQGMMAGKKAYAYGKNKERQKQKNK